MHTHALHKPRPECSRKSQAQRAFTISCWQLPRGRARNTGGDFELRFRVILDVLAMPCGLPPSFSSVSRRSQCTSSSNFISVRDLAQSQSTTHAAAASRSPTGPLAVSSSRYVQSSKHLRCFVHDFLFLFVQSPFHQVSYKSHPSCCLFDPKDFLGPPRIFFIAIVYSPIQSAFPSYSFCAFSVFVLLAAFLHFSDFDMTVGISGGSPARGVREVY
ncbi:hypothetical protein SCHPADRAFT_528041 [Schizopora paradoxa]|uniref:Transmembrane protein n=1 Tax=Schizopora paradoxa TaxID=27342 RepID=A0A0H2RF73_9AGAM|nr:hypothetical protein SCHPADRAFT_528041 [Schizopora paradoxa]